MEMLSPQCQSWFQKRIPLEAEPILRVRQPPQRSVALSPRGGDPGQTVGSRADVGAHGLAHGPLANPLALLMEMMEE